MKALVWVVTGSPGFDSQGVKGFGLGVGGTLEYFTA